ncbi:GTPase Era [Candidatus Gottesmanbacteria bacterium]|nr:GTPase Era [Candidatus Gottesmanbacteria bacterium]
MTKVGTVLLVGRPNVGKSSLLNNLLHTKVSITSPQPQTTRLVIRGLYEDERGQIIFLDTPGIFHKVESLVAKRVNETALKSINEGADLILYIVDRTRAHGEEENKIIGILRKIDTPKILVINKIDVLKPNHYAEYEIFADEFDAKVEISAIKETNLKKLLDMVFSYLPEGKIEDRKDLVYPVLNIDSKKFLAEIIREKVLLRTFDEIPHMATVEISDISEKTEPNMLIIKGKILTTDDRYKKILIGKGGQKIKEIGSMARKEIELMSNKKVFLDLQVETDPHWMEKYL